MVVEKIKQKSGILTWSEENINNAPTTPGLFILRSSPINGAVIYIGISFDLKETLMKVFKENPFPDTRFFDWYETDTEDDAELIKKEWDIKYNI
ncbi:MAG: hypothetical protein ABH831_01870 [Candidatus Nealsonbacteria bacterium]